MDRLYAGRFQTQKPQRLLRSRHEGGTPRAFHPHATGPKRFTARQRRDHVRDKKATPSRQRDSSRDLAGLTGFFNIKPGKLHGGKHPG
jgi:hypothetical protein